MSVPPGTGAGAGGRTTGITCQEDSRTKGAVWGSLAAVVVSGHYGESPRGSGSCPCLLFRSQSNPKGWKSVGRFEQDTGWLQDRHVDHGFVLWTHGHLRNKVLWAFRNLRSFPGVTQMKTCFGGLMGLREWEPRELPSS